MDVGWETQLLVMFRDEYLDCSTDDDISKRTGTRDKFDSRSLFMEFEIVDPELCSGAVKGSTSL